MNPFLKFLIMTMLLALPFRLCAGTEEKVTLEQLILELLKNNPDIQVSESRYRALQARPSQMRTLPDPVLSRAHLTRRLRHLLRRCVP